MIPIKILFTVLFLTYCGIACAQEVDTLKNKQVFVETPAEFPGGLNNLNRYIVKKFKYPYDAAQMRLGGTVYISFIVETDGSVSNINIFPKLDPSLDPKQLKASLAIYDQLINIMLKMPKWKPSEQGGIKVRSTFTLPFNMKP